MSSYGESVERKCEANESDSDNISTRSFSRYCKVNEGVSTRANGARRASRRRDKSEPCDKCDSKAHDTDSCPYYKKGRDDHPDAKRGKPKSLSSSGGNLVVRDATVVSMPGDGDCLFHSLAHGLGNTNARRLRSEIAAFIGSHPDLEIAEVPLKDW